MYKVKFVDINSDLIFSSEIPKIPSKNEFIGFWYKGDWSVSVIINNVYSFDEDGNFEYVEINLNFQSF